MDYRDLYEMQFGKVRPQETVSPDELQEASQRQAAELISRLDNHVLPSETTSE